MDVNNQGQSNGGDPAAAPGQEPHRVSANEENGSQENRNNPASSPPGPEAGAVLDYGDFDLDEEDVNAHGDADVPNEPAYDGEYRGEEDFERRSEHILIQELGPFRHELIRQISEQAQNNRQQVDAILDDFLEKLLLRDGVQLPRDELSQGFEAFFQQIRYGVPPEESWIGVGTPPQRGNDVEE